MVEQQRYPVSDAYEKGTLLTRAQYDVLYQQSITYPEHFWAEQARHFLQWQQPWHHVLTGQFQDGSIRWFEGGMLNASENCLDRHLATRANQTALIWESDDPALSKRLTYQALHEAVSRFANGLKSQGVNKGDTVCIYMPMLPEAVVAMLACARIGAIHSVVFAGFSPDALKMRIQDAGAKVVITADQGLRGGKTIPIKQHVDMALKECPNVTSVIVVKRTGRPVNWVGHRDIWYQELLEQEDAVCLPEKMAACDPLFILYTSGSTGKPKGVVHATGGYMVYATTTFQYVFDYHDGDIYWCTADVGWITGHTYVVYGPLALGATVVIYEGVPNFPTYSRCWEIIDKHKVNIFYTAPTAIRALRKEGDEWVTRCKRRSLKLLGTVGEPINPDVWEWYYHVVGDGRCPIVDTWWQTETGGIMVTPLPGATPLQPGAASWPFFGIVPGIVDDQGHAVANGVAGKFVIKQPWPGMMQTIYKNHERFIEAYFTEVPGAYLTGDGAICTKDGYYTITGRNDDVINVSGHRIGTGELESALLTHHDVSEAAVVGVKHDIKGQAIYAYVTTKEGVAQTDDLKKALVQHVRDLIGPIATPEVIQWANDLPKTRSGKIMRRILRKIANDATDEIGDTSTLADPSVVDALIAGRKRLMHSS